MSNKTMKFVAIGVGVTALLVGGIVWYEKKAAAAPVLTGGGTGPVKTIPVNALTAALVQQISGTPIHANVGDTISVQLGPPVSGSWVDQSTPGSFALQPISGFVMNYKVNAAGTLAIGYQGTTPNSPPVQWLAIPVQVP